MAGLTGGVACQSCGSPMPRAKDHGAAQIDNPYCSLCANAKGQLRSYDEVHRAMVEQRYMKVNKMPRPGAEEAATKALAHMPAWKNRTR